MTIDLGAVFGTVLLFVLVDTLLGGAPGRWWAEQVSPEIRRALGIQVTVTTGADADEEQETPKTKPPVIVVSILEGRLTMAEVLEQVEKANEQHGRYWSFTYVSHRYVVGRKWSKWWIGSDRSTVEAMLTEISLARTKVEPIEEEQPGLHLV